MQEGSDRAKWRNMYVQTHLMTAKMLLAMLGSNTSNLNSCKEFKAQCTNVQFTTNSKVSEINKGNKKGSPSAERLSFHRKLMQFSTEFSTGRSHSRRNKRSSVHREYQRPPYGRVTRSRTGWDHFSEIQRFKTGRESCDKHAFSFQLHREVEERDYLTTGTERKRKNSPRCRLNPLEKRMYKKRKER